MALPKLQTPSYEMEVPSTGTKVKYRPFLVKEQKVLMVAQETGNEKDMARAMCDIIRNCTDGAIKDPEKHPTFDIEYMFLQLRSKSVGDEVELNVLCPDDGKTRVPVKLKLSDVKLDRPEGHNPEVMITDTIGMKFKYPSMMDISKYTGNKMSNADLTFGVIRDCLVHIFDENEVYEDMNKQDVDEFIESMSTDQFAKVQQFFDTMPKLRHVVMVTNPNTEVESPVIIEGMQNFLA